MAWFNVATAGKHKHILKENASPPTSQSSSKTRGDLKPISNGSVQLQSLFSLSSWEQTLWLQLSGQCEVAKRFIYNSNFCALPGSLMQGKNLGLAAIPRKKGDMKFSLSYIKDFQSPFVICKVYKDFRQRREIIILVSIKSWNCSETKILNEQTS